MSVGLFYLAYLKICRIEFSFHKSEIDSFRTRVGHKKIDLLL